MESLTILPWEPTAEASRYFTFCAGEATPAGVTADVDGRELVPGNWYVAERVDTTEPEQEIVVASIAFATEEEAQAEATLIADAAEHGMTTYQAGGGDADPRHDQNDNPLVAGTWYVCSTVMRPGGWTAVDEVLAGPFTDEAEARQNLKAMTMTQGADTPTYTVSGPPAPTAALASEAAGRWAAQLYDETDPARAVAETGYIDGLNAINQPPTEYTADYRLGRGAGFISRMHQITPLETVVERTSDGYEVYVIGRHGKELVFLNDEFTETVTVDPDVARLRALHMGVLVSEPEDEPDVRDPKRFRALLASRDPIEVASAAAELGLLWLELREEAADLEAQRPVMRAALEKRLMAEEERLSASAAEKKARTHEEYLQCQTLCNEACTRRDQAEVLWSALTVLGWALVGRSHPASMTLVRD